MRRLERDGQSLVEFALSLSVFMLLIVGLLDGLRVAFYYNQVQEAARAGSRWGAVEVTRDGPSTWGDFTTPGNVPGTYCDPSPPCQYSLQSSRTWGTGPVTNTIVGAVTRNMVAANLRQATISISTTILISTGSPPQPTEEISQTSPLITNHPVTVTVQYPFKPVIGMLFGGVTINLKGSSSTLHA